MPARKPRALDRTAVVVTPAEIDVFDEPADRRCRRRLLAPKRRSWLGTIFVGAFGVLVSLAVGLWADQLIRDLFERAEWLGWLAAGAGRARRAGCWSSSSPARCWPWRALPRSRRLRAWRSTPLRATIRRSRAAWSPNSPASVAHKPETAAGRRALADLRGRDHRRRRPRAPRRGRTPRAARRQAQQTDPRRGQARVDRHGRQPARAGRPRLCRVRSRAG